MRLALYEYRESLRPLIHYGWSVECPCCGQRYREFLPHGRPVRRNALCRRCDGVERHRLLALYLRDRTDIFSRPMRVLHFASEPCIRNLLTHQPNVKLVTTDLEGPSDLRMDITKIALRDGAVDAILCIHVLEHIPDDRAALRELYRILAPGGWAILQVPLDTSRATTFEDPRITAPAERRKHFGQEDHVRMYGTDYQTRLGDAGFEVKRDDYVRKLDPAVVKRHALPAEEDIYFCLKPA